MYTSSSINRNPFTDPLFRRIVILPFIHLPIHELIPPINDISPRLYNDRSTVDWLSCSCIGLRNANPSLQHQTNQKCKANSNDFRSQKLKRKIGFSLSELSSPRKSDCENKTMFPLRSDLVPHEYLPAAPRIG